MPIGVGAYVDRCSKAGTDLPLIESESECEPGNDGTYGTMLKQYIMYTRPIVQKQLRIKKSITF